MNLVRVAGGLGNQLFQYSFYLFLVKNGSKSKLDLSLFELYNFHFGYEIDKVFNIDSSDSVFNSKNLPLKLQYSLIFKFSYHISKLIMVITDKQPLMSPIILEYYINEKNDNLYKLKNKYFIGNWFNHNSLIQNRSNLLDTFKFKISEGELSDENNQILAKVRKKTTISLHIRGGDYDLLARLPKEYYFKAIYYIKKKTEINKIVVFTDDIDWSLALLNIEGLEFVNHNIGSNSHLDMYLMSKAKNLIIANSTFSYWSAYLNKNADIIISPKFWFSQQEKSKKKYYPTPKALNSWIEL